MNQAPLFKPNLSKITQHLQFVARERNPQTSPGALKTVQSYISKEFESYGYGVEEDPFSHAGEPYQNLIARLDPDSLKPRLIVGAHFDAVPGSPGADDNASGVACLLEAARIYAASEKRNGFVEFAAFNLEEYGMIGSRAYVRRLKRQNTPVAGMLSLEMVGYTSHNKRSQKMPLFLKPFYPDVGNFIGLVANSKSSAFLKKVEVIFQSVKGLPVESVTLPANGQIFPDARLSDHSPFWDEGYPALLVTDTSFFRNPHYHTPTDTVDTLDLDFLVRITEAVAKTAFSFNG